MPWQKTFTLGSRRKGCHLVTSEITSAIQEGLQNVPIGILHLFIQHTSASITVNENCDPDVRTDMDMALDTIVPESLDWTHTDEGPDDSVSHTKASLVGSSVSIPITNGRLNLGTWQGQLHISYGISAHVTPEDVGCDYYSINVTKTKLFQR